jgi:hypothetical protein
MIQVVGEPDAHSALGRADERRADDVGGLGAEPEVVEREIERGTRGADEGCGGVRELESRLATVGQQPKLEAVPPGL